MCFGWPGVPPEELVDVQPTSVNWMVSDCDVCETNWWWPITTPLLDPLWFASGTELHPASSGFYLICSTVTYLHPIWGLPAPWRRSPGTAPPSTLVCNSWYLWTSHWPSLTRSSMEMRLKLKTMDFRRQPSSLLLLTKKHQPCRHGGPQNMTKY